MREINKEDSIANQYRKVWNKFHEVKKLTYIELGKPNPKNNKKNATQ